ncbi:thiamine pyrophosphate-dependent acetolactate synthase large subunit-like protein [Paraburkholderia sp. GAS42]
MPLDALCGKPFIEYDNPYDVGITGLIGSSSGCHAMMSCDPLLLLGCDFPYRPFSPLPDLVVFQRHRAGPSKIGSFGKP